MISECVYYYPQGHVDYSELLKDALFEYDLGFPTYIFKRKGKFIECYASVHYYSSAVVFSVFYKLPIQKGVKKRLKQITAKLICRTIPTIVFVQREPKYRILYSTEEPNTNEIIDTSNNYPEIEDSFSDEEQEKLDFCSSSNNYNLYNNSYDLLTDQTNESSYEDNLEKMNGDIPPIPPPRPPRPNSFNMTENDESQDFNYYGNSASCLPQNSQSQEFTSFKNEIVERLMSALGR